MMSALTAVLYGALLVYGAGWYLGYWIGNFSLLLFVLTIATLVYWLAERFRFAPARQAAADALAAQDAQRRADLAKQGKSIIMISSEMSEIIGMSNRVMVMCDGRVTGFIDGKDATQENIMELATQFETAPETAAANQ